MSTTEPLAERDPRQVGPYTLLGRLGSGAMGRVYLARTPNERLAAVKVVHETLASERSFRERFRREVAAARRVAGPRTAAVLDADPEAPLPWMAVEYVEGPTIEAQVKAHGPLPIGGIFWLADGVARALQEIHSAGVIHRDLKPTNVLLAPDGPRVIDFGIARATDASALTTMGMVTGSPAFMSPEQAVSGTIAPSSDIFALGAVLYFAATGQPVFGSGAPAALLYRVVHQDPDLSGIPDPELRALIGACLRKEPAARPGLAAIYAYCAIDPGTRDERILSVVPPGDPLSQTQRMAPVSALDAPTQIGIHGLQDQAAAGNAPGSNGSRRTALLAGIGLLVVLLAAGGGFAAVRIIRDNNSGQTGSAAPATTGPPATSAPAAAPATSAPATVPQTEPPATTPDGGGTGGPTYLYQVSADALPGLSGTQRSYTGDGVNSANSTSFRVGCDGQPWPTAFTSQAGATRITGTLLLDPQTTPADLVVDVTLVAGDRQIGKWRLRPGESKHLNRRIGGATKITLAAQAVSGTCGTALVGYGVVVDGALS